MISWFSFLSIFSFGKKKVFIKNENGLTRIALSFFFFFFLRMRMIELFIYLNIFFNVKKGDQSTATLLQ